mgnify:CR=1 FL=1
MGDIKIAIAGVGNCASALLQGIEYYRNRGSEDSVGLMHYDLGGYKAGDIKVVAAFDVDRRKVGKGLREAVFAKPNCTKIFWEKLPDYPVKVHMGYLSDGVSDHMSDYPDDVTFLPSDQPEADCLIYLPELSLELIESLEQSCCQGLILF